MRYTINGARFGNEDNSSAVIDTKEAGAVAISLVDTPDEWAAMIESGINIAPFEPETPSFFARDLLANLNATDYAAIQTAIAGSAALGLLWSSMLAQGGPINTGDERFLQGWMALTQALGRTRATQIAQALGFAS